MSAHKLDNLRERLLRAGVAPRHVRRYLRELSEHHDDALGAELARGLDAAAADAAAWARLGSEDSLAQSMLARPELRSKGARFPALAFGLGPMFGWLSLLIATLGALRLLSANGPSHGPLPAWMPGAAQALFVLYVRALPVSLGVVALVAAARRRLRLYWPLAGAALVDVVAGTFSIQVFAAMGQIGVSSSLLPLLVPFSDAWGPRDVAAFAEGLWRAAWMLGASALVYRASALVRPTSARSV